MPNSKPGCHKRAKRSPANLLVLDKVLGEMKNSSICNAIGEKNENFGAVGVQTAINKYGDKNEKFEAMNVKPANNIDNKHKNFGAL